MIFHLKSTVSETKAVSIASHLNAIHLFWNKKNIIITESSLNTVPSEINELVDEFWIFENDIQLASKKYISEKREIQIGSTTIGGNTNKTMIIGGPCSVESEEQIRSSSILLKNLGLTTLRGGCYKPRTSPYTFQGLGYEGLKLLVQMKKEFGLNIITEVRDATHVDEVIENTDIIQIGTKAMYDQGILRACAKVSKPVLLKRGFGTTLKEFVQAAEFILSGGNENVILCERGIRTFETNTRFTLDVCGIAWLQEHTNLPIVVDPSHAMGYAYGIPTLARACVAMGIDGLLIETHMNPLKAKSDASQQLTHSEFSALVNSLKPIAESIGYSIF